jgi:hypothetical protein
VLVRTSCPPPLVLPASTLHHDDCACSPHPTPSSPLLFYRSTGQRAHERSPGREAPRRLRSGPSSAQQSHFGMPRHSHVFPFSGSLPRLPVGKLHIMPSHHAFTYAFTSCLDIMPSHHARVKLHELRQGIRRQRVGQPSGVAGENAGFALAFPQLVLHPPKVAPMSRGARGCTMPWLVVSPAPR